MRTSEKWSEKSNKNKIIFFGDSVTYGGSIVSNQDLFTSKICKILSQYEVKTRVILTGTLIVARDMAHGKIKEKLDSGLEMPDYFKNHPIYYAGPAKTPHGMVTGSFGPTTAGRMDSYVKTFQEKGGSKVMLAKGNRSKQVTNSCKKNGGFY